MNGSTGRFVSLLSKDGVGKRVLGSLRGAGTKSPLAYAAKILRADIDQANDLDHAFRVFKYSRDLMRVANEPCSAIDTLVLFYASLLHDLAKSKNPHVQEDIARCLKSSCPVFEAQESDHGIRSAHYIKHRCDENALALYGLKEPGRVMLYNIVAFHSCGRLNDWFGNGSEGRSRQEVLLCLLFRLADIADGAHYRVEAASTVDQKKLAPKVKARSQVSDVLIRHNHVVWRIKKKTPQVEVAAEMENQRLSQMAVLLQAYGLPSQIVLEKGGKLITSVRTLVSDESLSSAGLRLGHNHRAGPIVLSGENLPDLYEQIVEAFHGVAVAGVPSAKDYVGPLVLEVRNTVHDDVRATKIRSEVGIDIEKVLTYAKQWLASDPGAARNFYFGYTHGQRIRNYRYPVLEELYQKPAEWSGSVNQYEHLLKVLRGEKQNARRAYCTVPNPLIGSLGSKIRDSGQLPPSLIAIHFRIEPCNRLSGFALLRSQELSVFSVLNYLEVKSLARNLLKDLRKKMKLKPGRVVLMSSLAYFDPSSVLLDKPAVCTVGKAILEHYATKINEAATRHKFADLVREYASRNYLEIEVDWAKEFAVSLPSEHSNLKKASENLVKGLRSLAEKRDKGKITGNSALEKKRALVDTFLQKLEGTNS